MFMFEQTTPESNCCLGFLQVRYVGLPACLAEWNRNMREMVANNDHVCKVVQILQF